MITEQLLQTKLQIPRRRAQAVAKARELGVLKTGPELRSKTVSN